MSGSLDIKARLTAERLLQKFGKLATYQKTTQGAYNPATGSTVNTTTDYPITIYIDSPESGDIQSGLANSMDSLILISAKELGVSVEVGDKIIAGATYEVKSDKPIYSGELIALHRVISVIR